MNPCPDCGRLLAANARTCPQCGRRLFKWADVFAGVFLAAVLGAVLYYLFR